MFSHYELEVIKEMCEEAVHCHTSALKMFDLDDPDEKKDWENVQTQIQGMNEMIRHCEDIQTEYASVDADDVIHRLEICKSFMALELARCTAGDLGAEEYAAEAYQIGYMQGRLELGLVTEADIKVLDDWEEMLNL